MTSRTVLLLQSAVVGALLAILFIVISATAKAQTCYGELTAGTSMTAIKTDVGVSAATKGLQGSIGAGCDLTIDRFLIGALARYEVASGDGTLMGLKVEAKPSWQALGRAGYWLNPNVAVYGVLGVSGTEFDLELVKAQKHRGIVYGLGTDININNGPAWLRLEWNRTGWKGEDYDGAKLTPGTDVIRAGVVIKFGALPK